LPDTATNYVPVKQWPASEQPREKLQKFGAEHLSDAELLAILLRTGVHGESVLALAGRLLREFHGLAGLGKASFDELRVFHGLGPAKSCDILAAVELGRRYLSRMPDEQMTIRSPRYVADYLKPTLAHLDHEELHVILLNTKNRVHARHVVYKGSVNTAVLRVAEVFKEAVRAACPFIIIAHNHPSGDPTPSAEDIAVTRQMVAAGKLLDIAVLDHLVFGHGDFVSLKERNLGFS
jgi:DNA repair protein RadC